MNRKLHILFLCSWYPSRVIPFNGDFIQRHAEAVTLEHKVTALHIVTDPDCKQTIEIDRKVLKGVDTIIAYLKQTRNTFKKAYLFCRAFRKIIKEIDRVDIVHLNILFPLGIFALYLKWFRKKPFIISEHWTSYQYPLCKNISLVERFISTIITKNALFVCPVSRHLQKAMQDLGFKGNYYPVPNVIDTDLFIPSNLKSPEFNILHISSMNDHQKNISGILDVISELQHKISDFKFIFIGNKLKKYEMIANELNINKDTLTFIDHIEQKNLVNYYQEATVFMLFSNYENLPCVILESFACGIPVISTNVGGISEYFPEDFGALVPANDREKLLKVLMNVYNHNLEISTSDKMHNYAVENFSKKKICDTFTRLYTQKLAD